MALNRAAWRSTTLGRIVAALEVETVMGLVGPSPAGRRFLNVGCGNGAYAVAATGDGTRVAGLDSQAKLRATAGRRAEEAGVEIRLVQG